MSGDDFQVGSDVPKGSSLGLGLICGLAAVGVDNKVQNDVNSSEIE